MKMQEQRRIQEEIFAQARISMMQEFNNPKPSKFTIPQPSSIPKPRSSNSSSSSRRRQNTINPHFDVNATKQIYSEIESKVNQLAAKLANDFLTQGSSAEKDHDKVFLVYKFLNTPAEVLQEGLFQMYQRQEANSYFKKLAKQLHPDKNSHPLAKDAFQKLSTTLSLVRE